MNFLQTLANMAHGIERGIQGGQPQPSAQVPSYGGGIAQHKITAPQYSLQAQHQAPMQQQTYTPQQQAQMTPVGQSIPESMMDSFSPQTRTLAQIYQNNPADPRVMHLDPAMFGYAPDNTARSPQHQLQINPYTQLGGARLGQLQGRDNPGYIPIQDSGIGHFGANPYTTGMQPSSAMQVRQAPVYSPQNPYSLQ